MMLKEELKPNWSEEQRAAGERLRKSWEAFSSAAGRAEESSEGSMLGPAEEQRITALQARHQAKLLRYPNVVGLAPGIRTKRGKPTGERCLVVYVERKTPKAKLAKSEVLPSEIEGVPVDVVEVGEVGILPM